jgi:hypothetical protein
MQSRGIAESPSTVAATARPAEIFTEPLGKGAPSSAASRCVGASGRAHEYQLGQRFFFLWVRASRIIALSRFSRRLRRLLISRCRSEAIVDRHCSRRDRDCARASQHQRPLGYLSRVS